MPSIVAWQDRMSRRHMAQQIELARAKAFRENLRPPKISAFTQPQSRLCPDPTAARAYVAQLRAEPLPHGDERVITVTPAPFAPEPKSESEQLQLVGTTRPQTEVEVEVPWPIRGRTEADP